MENEKDIEERQVLINKIKVLEDKLKKVDERIKIRTVTFSELFSGILFSSKNTSKSEKTKYLIQGGDTMKFQGVSVLKHKTCNTWYARFRNNGKQFYISAKTQIDCYNKLKQALSQKQQSFQKEKKPAITFADWYKKWLDLYKHDVKQSTVVQYNVCMKHLNAISNKQINKITGIDLIEQLNKISGERTKQKVYDFANSLFDKALINEFVSKNPLSLVDKPKHRRVNGKALTSEDEEVFENLSIQNNADIFLICLYQGLRRGEALALTGTDIDLEHNLLTINKSLNQNNKLDTTKNIYSNRVMPIFEKSIPILKKYAGIKNRIFNFSHKICEKKFKELSNNLSQKYTIHSLRHTFITKCQEKQVPLHIIQKWVGHNIGSQVTNQVYTHTRDVAEFENIEKMNKI